MFKIVNLYHMARGLSVRGCTFVGAGLILKGKSQNIKIGRRVSIGKNVELKIRDNSRIVLSDGAKIDDNVRLISANGSTLFIGPETKVMFCSIINAGANIYIGEKTGIAAYNMINSSQHITEASSAWMDQGYKHSPIRIGRDVLIGSHCSILPNVNIGNGAIITTHSVINNDCQKKMIYTGIPARVVGKRL